MVFRSVIVLVFSFIIGLQAKAQSISIKDAETKTPIEYATITSAGAFIGYTDENGTLELPKGVDSICITHINYTESCINKPFPSEISLSPGIRLQRISVRANGDIPHMRTIPIQTSIINPSENTAQIALNAADFASRATGVHVQKSQQGGGSPMIRGFAANRILLIIDGVRMNTAIFRSGNIQNLINIDPHHISSMHVHMGPHSLLYGSDALGGVVEIQSITPDYFKKEGIHGKFGIQLNSANNQYSPHGLIAIKKERWSYVGDVTYSRYGDLRMGSHGPERYLRTFRAFRVDNQDLNGVTVNPKVQRPSSYTQWNTRHIIDFKLNEAHIIEYGFYASSTSDISRYDRLIQPGNSSLFRNAEWYYGPQKWSMHRLALRKRSGLNKTSWSAQLARQSFEESRNDRRFGSEILRNRREQVDAYSLNLDLRSRQDQKLNWTAGAEGVFNYVNSEGESINIVTQERAEIASRYPDGSSWYSAGLYAQAGYLISEKLGASAGMRYTLNGLRGDADNRLQELPVTQLDQNSSAISSSLGINYSLHKNWTSSLTLSNAFRAPNIDDAAKIFDSEPGTVLVPNPDLQPEYSYSVELGIRKHSGRFTGRLNLFYTWLDNILDRAPAQVTGQDSILYDGVLSQIFSVQNLQNGHVYGLEADLSIKLTDRLFWVNQISYQKGSETTDEGTVALRHVTPFLHRSILRYNHKRWSAECNWAYSGSISYNNLAPSERAKPYLYDLNTDGLPYSPSWHDLAISAGYRINTITTQLSLFNLFDQRYRTYSSGIAAPGRGVNASVSFEF